MSTDHKKPWVLSCGTPYSPLTFDRTQAFGYKVGMRVVARLLVLLPLLWVERVWAVDCPQSNYELTTQAEVDALGATGCDRVSGNLKISRSSDITNLDGLGSCTAAWGGNANGMCSLEPFTPRGHTASELSPTRTTTSVGPFRCAIHGHISATTAAAA